MTQSTSEPSGPETPKFSLQYKNESPTGPYHWKLIVEWFELGLIDDFSYIRANGSVAPVRELVDVCGVPPTISVNSIFLSPSDDAKPCAKSDLEALEALGFPKVQAKIADELVTHLTKRLKLGDAGLDAEDAKFGTPTIPSAEELEASASAPELDAEDEPDEDSEVDGHIREA